MEDLSSLGLDELYRRAEHLQAVMEEVEYEQRTLQDGIRSIDDLYDAASIEGVEEAGALLWKAQSIMKAREDVLDDLYVALERAREVFAQRIIEVEYAEDAAKTADAEKWRTVMRYPESD